MKTKFDRSAPFKDAWKLYKAQDVKTMEMWSICLRQAWAEIKTLAKNVIDIEIIYKNYYDQIFHFILSSVSNNNDALDLTQDAFLKIAKKLHLFDSSKSKLSTWLHTVAKNVVIDHYRKDNSNNYVDADNDDAETNHEYFIDNDLGINERQNIVKQVEQAIMKLKPEYKELATMFFIEDRSYKDIVNVLDIPEGTVKGRINRIRAILQPVLQDVA